MRRIKGLLRGLATMRARGDVIGRAGGLARAQQMRVDRLARVELERYRALYGPLPELDPREGYPAYILQ